MKSFQLKIMNREQVAGKVLLISAKIVNKYCAI